MGVVVVIRYEVCKNLPIEQFCADNWGILLNTESFPFSSRVCAKKFTVIFVLKILVLVANNHVERYDAKFSQRLNLTFV